VYYRPSAPVAGGNADGTVQALLAGSTPVQVVPSSLGERYPYRPRQPSRHLHQTLLPGRLALPPLGWAVAPSTEPASCEKDMNKILVTKVLIIINLDMIPRGMSVISYAMF
jgi:hypothetical protein